MSIKEIAAFGQGALKGMRRAGVLLLVLAALTGPVTAYGQGQGQGGNGQGGNGQGRSAPEIDPGSMVSAMTLLTGGVLILMDRYRRK
ncbi:MAG: hypothetical protein JO284_03665 [Planctomycetaceae bacterium]|nr:hypothetical protein [Planctomycetaceae bacterium]MBV8235779.1 hypothetical protein [Acidimicrobiia bacterium]